MIKITGVRVHKLAGEGKFLAYASITIEECFVVKDLKIIQGENGPFVVMPSRKKLDGEYLDIAHPITSEAREYIQKTVLEEYEKTA